MPSDIIGKVPKIKISTQESIAEYLKFLEQSKHVNAGTVKPGTVVDYFGRLK